MKYQPRYDGFRGLCIAAVFLFHSSFLACGWIGVQAFFVLSGFLITGVLLDAKDRSTAAGSYFGQFYMRRALRIFPVYFAFLAAVPILAVLAGPEMSEAVLAHAREHAPYLVTYTYNFFRIAGGLGSPFFGHLWSLSIEEQFYLLWPICVLMVRRSALPKLCLGVVIAGPIVRLIEWAWIIKFAPGSAGDAGRIIYFLTMSHFDAFAIGGLLNFRKQSAFAGRMADASPRWLLLLVAIPSAMMLGVAVLARQGPEWTSFGWPIYLQPFHAHIWGYTALNIACFQALAHIESLPLAGSRIVQRLGKVSYGFYIFHLPILWLAFMVSGAERGSLTVLNLIATGLAFALTWMLAEASFRFLEMPFLNMKRRFEPGAAQAFPLP